MISLRQATLADLPLVERWDDDAHRFYQRLAFALLSGVRFSAWMTVLSLN